MNPPLRATNMVGASLKSQAAVEQLSQPNHNSEIALELERLGRAVDLYHAILDTLSDRLQPVLQQVPPPAGGASEAIPTPSSALGQVIQERHNGLLAANDRLIALISRLAI